MIRCQNCGQDNSGGSNFCRFCGVKFSHMPMQRQPDKPQPPPVRRPYSWKTDEFQVKKGSVKQTQRINQVRPLANMPNQPNQQMAPRPQPHAPQHYHQQMTTYGYRCPRCSSQLMPRVTRKISSAGWVTFAILLVTFFPLFWIGLLIKEDVKTCPVCNVRVH